jgi:predicted DNA-binding transcriptional regulator AlpA
MVRAATKSKPRKSQKATPSEALADLNLADDPLLKTAAAAALVGLSQKTLRQLRCDRAGPRYFKMGVAQQARAVYRRSDLEAWVRSQARAVGGARP